MAMGIAITGTHVSPSFPSMRQATEMKECRGIRKMSPITFKAHQSESIAIARDIGAREQAAIMQLASLGTFRKGFRCCKLTQVSDCTWRTTVPYRSKKCH